MIIILILIMIIMTIIIINMISIIFKRYALALLLSIQDVRTVKESYTSRWLLADF